MLLFGLLKKVLTVQTLPGKSHNTLPPKHLSSPTYSKTLPTFSLVLGPAFNTT
jgi:hypothetical protein